MERHRVAIRRVTVVLLVASVCLILPGLAGVGATVALAAGLGVTAVVLAALRATLAAAPTVLGSDLSNYAPDLWLAPLVAAGVIVAFSGATAAELQSLGGVAGFVAMVNYFLSPVYGFVYRLVVRLVRTLDVA